MNIIELWKTVKAVYARVVYDLWIWRVTYPNGEVTRRLGYREALSLKKLHGGRLGSTSFKNSRICPRSCRRRMRRVEVLWDIRACREVLAGEKPNHGAEPF